MQKQHPQTAYRKYAILIGTIQAEGAFGQLKHNRSFKRFLTGGNIKVLAELLFLGAFSEFLTLKFGQCAYRLDYCFIFQGQFFHFCSIHRDREVEDNLPNPVAIRLLFRE